ncbi:hypothetical protein BROUX41_004470 [Berkeleyomyces rouxiae]
MDLDINALSAVIYPTAAFLPPVSSAHIEDWGSSFMNPAARYNNLSAPTSPLWRIESSGGLGSHYLVYPLFLEFVPPLRLDIFIPCATKLPSAIRSGLDLGAAFYTKDCRHLARLGIAAYLLQALQAWTLRIPDPAAWYTSQIFGSRLIFKDLPQDPATATIDLVPMYSLEASFLPVPALEQLWASELALPDSVDISRVHVVRQLQDSVAIVEVDGTTYVLKALTSCPKFIYHELHVLLTLAKSPHPNICSPPVKLVTKDCTFGSSRGVMGFLSEYHSPGTIRDILPRRRLAGTLTPELQIRWAQQITSALSHVSSPAMGLYYPDLRCDNILLSDDDHIVMVDFEQRGVWCEFAPPEVNAVEYIRILADGNDADPEVCTRFADRLTRLVPDWENLTRSEQYHSPGEGYHIPWLTLSKGEREYAEVYMLGRVLWCIFEGVSAPEKAAIWQSYAHESHLEFPQYDLAPPTIRDLIDRCTRGRRPTLSEKVVRRKGQMVVKNLSEYADSLQAHEDRVQRVARDFWRAEIEAAEEWLDLRESRIKQGTWSDNYYNRPTLRDVEQELEAYARSLEVSSGDGISNI